MDTGRPTEIAGSRRPHWPIPTPQDVLIFGGSFDPPHRGHIDTSLAARDVVFGENEAWLVVVPAARSPFKDSGPLAGSADRVAMLERAFQGVDRVRVWTEEVWRAADGGPSYTVETLERAASIAPTGTRLRLLIGADQALTFHKWHRADRIVELAEPVVVLRPPYRSASELFQAGLDEREWGCRIVRSPLIDAASSAWREDRPEGLLPEGVADYIRERGLYQG